ncbi:MAG TPA: hypothetical protein VFE50_17095 [Cyclobacteriaceae bacterium]|nr:hypothetical protein [Cyclobacteriaceae bacterium]
MFANLLGIVLRQARRNPTGARDWSTQGARRTTASIMLLISGGYLRLMAVACLIAVPVIYFTIDSWLSRFAYHVELSPLHFVGGVIVVMFIAGLTVGHHSVKASTTNPPGL